jgi:methylmalonyl-CoA mutase cobalamin-binding subunit
MTKETNHAPGRAAAVQALEADLPGLAAAASEKLALDVRFECLGPGCDNAALIDEYNLLFGRTYAALLDVGLLDRLGVEFDWFRRVLGRRGFEPEFFPRMLEAWVMALGSRLSPHLATELAIPLDSLRRELDEPVPEPVTVAVDVAVAEFLGLLVARRRSEAAGFLLGVSGSPAERVRSVVLSALAELGRLWERDEMSVAEEHAATETCRYCLMRLYDEPLPPARPGRRGLVACVPGEEHDVGAWLVAAELERAGWDVFYAGRSVPESDIVRGLRSIEARAAFLSCQHVINLPSARRVVEHIGRELPGVKVVLGGHAASLAAQRLARPGVVTVDRFDRADAAARGLDA